MLPINADEHPLMSCMHKPDPKFAPNQQDKRSVVVVEDSDAEQLLLATQVFDSHATWFAHAGARDGAV